MTRQKKKVQPLPWKDEAKRVVNINTKKKDDTSSLVDEIKKELVRQKEIKKSNAFTAAQFALQMIQGAEKVRFIAML